MGGAGGIPTPNFGAGLFAGTPGGVPGGGGSGDMSGVSGNNGAHGRVVVWW